MNYKDKILAYLKSGRRGKTANSFEREAIDDFFLNDALDGFATIDDIQLIADMDKLQKLLEQRTQRRSNKTITRWVYSSAAILLVAVTASYWFLGNNNTSKEQLAIVDETNLLQKKSTFDNSDINLLPTNEEQNQLTVEATGKEIINNQAEINPQNTANNQDDKNRRTASDIVSPQNDISTQQAVSTQNIDRQQQEQVAEPVQNTDIILSGGNEIEAEVTEQEEQKVAPQVATGSVVPREKGTLTSTPPNKDIATGTPKQKKGAVLPHSSGGQYEYNALYGGSTSTKKELEPVDGMKKYEQYLKENLVYPADAKEQNKKGKITLSFLISAEGRPYDIKVEKGLLPSCDAEAIRLVSDGSNWTPSKTNPQKRVKLKIEFSL